MNSANREHIRSYIHANFDTINFRIQNCKPHSKPLPMVQTYNVQRTDLVGRNPGDWKRWRPLDLTNWHLVFDFIELTFAVKICMDKINTEREPLWISSTKIIELSDPDFSNFIKRPICFLPLKNCDNFLLLDEIWKPDHLIRWPWWKRSW